VSPLTGVLRVAATVVVGFVCWVAVGYLVTAPLGAIYGWSGHPSIPAAPTEVYVGLYLVVLPVVCLLAAWRLVVLVEGTFRRARGRSS
jgi:hypothetical protein